ncbi:Protein CBG27862 [Caenorhabditis briggsae]|uniref:Protein CBG27862 n=1 Tax=Caenorhabditis briggsae TaxID=6238 RepID=B6IEF7_CAEBR|nr:Protein CBG27862 [Caenorhabditis briggsae]CAR98287.1 Protein CBG27862 [Caenorhabditis briggsae]
MFTVLILDFLFSTFSKKFQSFFLVYYIIILFSVAELFVFISSLVSCLVQFAAYVSSSKFLLKFPISTKRLINIQFQVQTV